MNTFRMAAFQNPGILFLAALLITGCAMLPVPTRSVHIGETGPVGSCADFFASLDKEIEEAEVLDPGFFRVKNYPYLRVNRFLASFREEIDDQLAFAGWVDRMQVLDQEARQYEIANLPDSAVAALDSVNDRAGLSRQVAACGDLLKAADFQSVEHQANLKRNVAVPDEYLGFRRALGVYPLTSMFVYRGVSIWHAEARKRFSPAPPVNWRTIRYAPARKNDVSSAPQPGGPGQRDKLGIPVYSPADREALFRRYAPVWEIQLSGDYDRIGTPIWTDKGALEVNIGQPLTYTLISFTRFGKDLLTQLNYIIWFPARPKEGALDIYGGLLDGLNYRVTLDRDNEPLLYETMHNCGCYYKAYPTDRLRIREKIEYAEPPLVLQAPAVNPINDSVVVSMESRTHYVHHLYSSSRELQNTAAIYSFADYGRLQSLPISSGTRRSMFSQNSITPGSERLERFILWPTGVLSPGAMRQWGRHAVAFVGKRHFDDPFYMDKIFIRNRADKN